MRGDSLPDSDHVARYCKFTWLTEDGRVRGGAFLPRVNERYLSVFWLEYAGIPDRDAQISDTRRRMSESRITLRSNAKIAVLATGSLKDAVRTEYNRELAVKHEPELDDGKYVDPSHAGIYGLMPLDEEIAAFISEEVVESTYPAKI